MMRRFFLCLALLCAAGAAQARPAHPPLLLPPAHAPSWSQLTPGQRVDLAMLEGRWDRMPPERRAQILLRWQRWQRLPPEQREALREGRRNFREMSPDQRERMRESWRAMKSLPPGERERLRSIWRDLSPQQRREWLKRGGPGVAPPPP